MFYIFSRLKTTPFGSYHSSWDAPIDPHVLQPAYASLHQHQQSAVQPTYASLQLFQTNKDSSQIRAAIPYLIDQIRAKVSLTLICSGLPLFD